MNITTFTSQSGELTYATQINNPSGDLFFGFGYSGTGASDPLVKKITFSGSSGKLYDSDNNFFLGLTPNTILTISGNIFTGYHSFFVGYPPSQGVSLRDYYLINNNSSRITGDINCVFYQSDALTAAPGTASSLFKLAIKSP